MTDTSNFFDFSDVSDLSDEAAKRVASDPKAGTAANGRKWGNLVAGAGRKVSMSEVIAAAERAFGADNVPKADQTVRAYLASAVEQGIIYKPTKASYAVVPADGVLVHEADEDEAEETEEVAPVQEEQSNDPLAGLMG